MTLHALLVSERGERMRRRSSTLSLQLVATGFFLVAVALLMSGLVLFLHES